MPEGINIRFKTLRIACEKSQEEFGKVLGISKSGISDIENGRRKVTDQHLIMLRNWTEFNVNENWLRTGEGEIFITMTPDEDIAFFMGQLLSKEDNTPKKKFFIAMSKLSDEWFIELYNAIESEYKKNE